MPGPCVGDVVQAPGVPRVANSEMTKMSGHAGHYSCHRIENSYYTMIKARWRREIVQAFCGNWERRVDSEQKKETGHELQNQIETYSTFIEGL